MVQKNKQQINLILYALEPGQEFSKINRKDNKNKIILNKSNTYYNHDNYSNHNNHFNHDNYYNYNNIRDSYYTSKVNKNIKNLKLTDFIRLRQDNEKYGFVHNLKTNNIYYADKKTIDLLNLLRDNNISQIKKYHPKILEKLNLNND